VKKTCPICASPGEDLVFKFECTNPECQNYVKRSQSQSQERESKESEETGSDLDDPTLDWMISSD
jgi:hypothetical protein